MTTSRATIASFTHEPRTTSGIWLQANVRTGWVLSHMQQASGKHRPRSSSHLLEIVRVSLEENICNTTGPDKHLAKMIICISGNSVQYQLPRGRDSVIYSILSMLFLFYSLLFPYFEAARGGKKNPTSPDVIHQIKWLVLILVLN